MKALKKMNEAYEFTLLSVRLYGYLCVYPPNLKYKRVMKSPWYVSLCIVTEYDHLLGND
jgi:hypothetical protein